MKGLVVEAEDLFNALQVGVLHHKVPLAEVLSIVQVGYSHLNPPIILVAHLHMPMHLNGAHVPRAHHYRVWRAIAVWHLEIRWQLIRPVTCSQESEIHRTWKFEENS